MAQDLENPSQLPDTDFASTRYGLLRISQAVIGFLCIVLIECTGDCWAYSSHNHNFFASLASSSMIFAILVMILFCFRLQDPLERYINVPLTLCVTETIFAVFYCVGSLLLIVSYCPKTGLSIITKVVGMLGIVGTFIFGYAAKMSYQWFRTGTLSDVA